MNPYWRKILWFSVMIFTTQYSCKPRQNPERKADRDINQGQNPMPAGPLGQLSPLEDKTLPARDLDRRDSMPLSEFVFPLPGAQIGSRWCVCRSIGTSPHIGQDYSTPSGDQISIAVGQGTISKISFDSTCGYAVELNDVNGAKWIYRHCDKPEISEGQSITTGQRICKHERWPTSGCGTGPHLHLERRSASKVIPGDSETGKACHYGYSTCYFDPTVIDSAQRSPRTASLALTDGQNAIQNSPLPQLDDLAASIKPASKSTPYCLNPEPTSKPSSFSDNPIPDETLIAEFETESLPDGRRILSLLNIRHAKDITGANQCSEGTTKQECIRKLQIYSQDRNEKWKLLADLTAMDNQPLTLDRRSGLCIENGINQIWIAGQTPNGRNLQTQLSLP